MAKKKTKTDHTFYYIFYLLFIWTVYRYFVEIPDFAEELIVKPVIWLVPILFILKKQKRKLKSLGITKKNLFKGLYFALALGAVFAIEAIFANFAKYGSFQFNADIGNSEIFVPLLLSFVTAFSEEVTFRGYVFNRMWEKVESEWVANFIATLFWTAIHVPIVIFVWGLNFQASLTYLLLITIFGIGSSFVFARTRNVFSSVFLHVLWEWPIILFR